MSWAPVTTRTAETTTIMRQQDRSTAATVVLNRGVAGARGPRRDDGASCRHLRLGRPASAWATALCSSRIAVAPDHLVGDDHGQHDDALGDLDDARREMSVSSVSGLDCSSRNANSSAPKMMPTGWLRPSSATAMPVKPRPAWNVVP